MQPFSPSSLLSLHSLSLPPPSLSLIPHLGVIPMEARRGRWIPWDWGYRWLWGHWEWNPSLLEGQPALFTAGLLSRLCLALYMDLKPALHTWKPSTLPLSCLLGPVRWPLVQLPVDLVEFSHLIKTLRGWLDTVDRSIDHSCLPQRSRPPSQYGVFGTSESTLLCVCVCVFLSPVVMFKAMRNLSRLTCTTCSWGALRAVQPTALSFLIL